MRFRKASRPASDKALREPRTVSRAGGLEDREATVNKPPLQVLACYSCRRQA